MEDDLVKLRIRGCFYFWDVNLKEVMKEVCKVIWVREDFIVVRLFGF